MKERSDMAARPYVKPISYAEIENPNPIPDFRDGLKIDKRPENRGNDYQQRNNSRQAPLKDRQAPANGSSAPAAQPSVGGDVEM